MARHFAGTVESSGTFSFFLFFFSHTSTFQLLDKPWSQVSSLLPPGSCLQFLSRIGFSNPAVRRFFIECHYSTGAFGSPCIEILRNLKSAFVLGAERDASANPGGKSRPCLVDRCL